MKLGIVDHGMGNLLSVRHAFEALGADPILCARPSDLRRVDRIVLPGVGAFGDCMSRLNELGFVDELHDLVLEGGRPAIGICLGMQVMAERSAEGPEIRGLGWVKGDAVRLDPGTANLRVPHAGWNDVEYDPASPLFRGLPERPDFYFVHSYWVDCADRSVVEATCDYGGAITAALRKDNICATQFHPEKSQDFGLKLLENFLQWEP